MRRSTNRRAATGRGPDRRTIAGAAALVVLAGVIGVTQISNAAVNGEPQEKNGLQILGDSCENSNLGAHDGFQNGDRCVSTAMGEVADAAQNPSLLITEAPEEVAVGETFTLQVSTRNLVRDRFLGAAAGGYYLESSFLNADGIQRGHFHVSCRMLTSTDEAPDPEPVPAFFRAVEDGGGGAEPDQVTIEVSGMPEEGLAHCAVWAGDGSHRMPMMERANQTPAADAVRIQVGGGGNEQPPAEEPPAEEPPAEEPPAEEPPAEEPPAEQPPAEEPPAEEPPAEEPPAEQPPAEQPQNPGGNNNGNNNGGNNNGGEEQEEAPPAEIEEEDSGDDAAGEPAPLRPNNGGNNPIAAENAADTGEQEEDSQRLALTGANTIALLAAGAMLVIAGMMLLGSTRRRRDSYYR